MSVDTAKVTARRELHFQSIQDLLDDVEAVQAAPQIETLGNWSAGHDLQASGQHGVLPKS